MAKPTSYHNLEFCDVSQEGILVTALIFMPEAMSSVIDMVPTPLIFQDENIRKIYLALEALYHDRAEIKKLSVMQKLQSTGGISVIKKSGLSLNFDNMTPNSVEAIHSTVNSLVSLYRRQIAYGLTLKLNNDLSNTATDEEISDGVFEVYQALTLDNIKTMEKTSRQAADGALKMIRAAMQKRKETGTSGIPTGFSKLDREIGGWQKDEVILLGGRPGMGKTALALYCMLSAAEQGVPVGFFSMEMDSENLNFRLAAIKAGVEYSKMIKGDITLEEYALIETQLDFIGNLPIYYFDNTSITDVTKLEAIATEWCRRYGVEMVYIDYIQYLEKSGVRGIYETITAVSKAVKGMNRKLKIPIMALAQLSREVDKRPNPIPVKEDLKESGQLEQDASTIIGCFNPDYYLRQGREIVDDQRGGVPYESNAYMLMILKRRSGGHCRIDLYADLALNRFYESNIFNQLDIFAPKPFTNIEVVRKGYEPEANVNPDDEDGLPF